jgi:hypothetical protein
MKRTSWRWYERIVAAMLCTPLQFAVVQSLAWSTPVSLQPWNRHSRNCNTLQRHRDQTGTCAERTRLNRPHSRSTPTTLCSEQSTSSPQSASGSSSSSGLVAQSDLVKTQLLSAFTNLGVSDQYDAVLTGLCAKILDAPKGSTTGADANLEDASTPVSLSDCTDLLQEMNSQSIPASPRSLMALVDVRLVALIVLSVALVQCARLFPVFESLVKSLQHASSHELFDCSCVGVFLLHASLVISLPI